MHSRHIYILVLAELALLYFGAQGAAWAQQAQWTPELLQPAAGTREPSEPLRIRLTNVPAQTLEILALELDEIDVTSMVTMEGDVVVYAPPQALAYGEHQLRLVEHSPDGSINERGQWTFELRKSTLFRDAKANANITVKGSYRAADKGLANPEPVRGQAEGTGQFAGSAETENWRASGALTLIANNQSQTTPGNAGHLNLGQFLAAADSGLFGFKVGDHPIGPDSMVVQSFNRRGVSVSATAPGDKAAITGFSMNSTPQTGFDGLGLSDSSNRVDGVLATVKPVPGNAEALALMGTYVSGWSGNQTGPSVGGGPDTSRGSASSMVADSNLAQQRLRLRGEYAKSSYYFDGPGSASAQDGHAYSGLVNYVPWHDKIAFDQPFLWNLGLEKKLVSSYFRSPANPGGISDRDMSRAFTGVNWYGLDVQLNAGKEYDNVDDNPLIPTTESRQRSCAITFSPKANNAPQTNGQPPEIPWYGQPTLNASFMSLNREYVQINGAAASLPTHSTYNSVAGANFQYAKWNWGIMQTWVSDQGYNLDPTPLTRTPATHLQGNFRFDNKLTVGMNAFTQNADNINTGINTNGIGGGINLAYPFTDTVNGILTYATRHDWTTDGSTESVTSDTTAALTWAVNKPNGVRPGTTLGIDGSFHDVSSNSPMPSQPGIAMYQVFVRLTLIWAPAY